MLGRRPPPSWKGLVVSASSSSGYDVVVEPDVADQAPLAVTSGPSERPGITHASLEGVARALAVRAGGGTPVWTVAGRRIHRGRWWAFPAPLGPVLGEAGSVPVDGEMAGAGAFGGRALVAVDDRRFLSAAALAAGALLVGTGPLDGPVPVWDMAEDYLAACEDLGVVIAEANP